MFAIARMLPIPAQPLPARGFALLAVALPAVAVAGGAGAGANVLAGSCARATTSARVG